MLLGVIAGIICWALGKYVMGLPFVFTNFVFIVINRTVLGMVIALVQPIDLDRKIRGPLFGLLAGSILSYSDFMAGYGATVVFSVTFMSLLYGFVIDYCLQKITN